MTFSQKYLKCKKYLSKKKFLEQACPQTPLGISGLRRLFCPSPQFYYPGDATDPIDPKKVARFFLTATKRSAIFLDRPQKVGQFCDQSQNIKLIDRPQKVDFFNRPQNVGDFFTNPRSPSIFLKRSVNFFDRLQEVVGFDRLQKVAQFIFINPIRSGKFLDLPHEVDRKIF